jgi:hypothetical protein
MSSTDQLLIVQFDKSDAELQQSLTDTFGDNAKPIDAYGFDGGVIDALQVAIPIATATLPFLLKYFTAHEATIRSRRVVLGPKGGVTLVGYDESEVATILDKIAPGKR